MGTHGRRAWLPPVLAHDPLENGHGFISTLFGDPSRACLPPGSPPHGPGSELGLRTIPHGGAFLRKTGGPRPELEEEVRGQQASEGAGLQPVGLGVLAAPPCPFWGHREGQGGTGEREPESGSLPAASRPPVNGSSLGRSRAG